jgi:hypothetical protein
MIVFVFRLILAIYPAILFRIFLLVSVFPSAFLFSSNVFPNESDDFSINCLDVLFTSVGFILPMIMDANFGL